MNLLSARLLTSALRRLAAAVAVGSALLAEPVPAGAQSPFIADVRVSDNSAVSSSDSQDLLRNSRIVVTTKSSSDAVARYAVEYLPIVHRRT